MPERSCPSCGLEVAAHQTLCPRCRAPVPSDAGPVAPSADSSSITVGAPPPRAPLPGARASTSVGPPPSDPAGPDDEPTVAAAPGAEPGVEPTVDATRAPEPTVVMGGPGAASSGPGRDAADERTWHQAMPVAASPAAPQQAPSAPSAGTLGVAGAPTLDDRGNLPGGLTGVLGAVLVLVGVVLPWLDVAGETVSGYAASDDAKVLIGLAGVATVAAALVVGGARSLVLRILLGVTGVVAFGIGLVDLASVGGVEDLDPAPGVGLHAVLGGGALLVLAGLLTRHRRVR